MNILVTGGAGFIGSHLIDRLVVNGNRVVCVDDLSLGKLSNIDHHLSNSSFSFHKADILDKVVMRELFLKNRFDVVFHMAANSDIQKSHETPSVDLQKTLMTTYNVLELMREAKVRQIVFASTSAIYGEQEEELYEDIGPLFPISIYGAAKLSSEAFISAFSENYGINSWICRFPNVVGERATHGAMFDFVSRLKADPTKLRILGDGNQEKPYLYVKDLVEGLLFVWQNAKDKLNYYNLGVEDALTVRRIAEIVVEEMKLPNVKFEFTGGERGWIGDVPKFRYSLEKVHRLGWKAKRTSQDSVRLAVQSYLREIQ